MEKEKLKIILVRHGHSLKGVGVLTTTGKDQMRQLGGRLEQLLTGDDVRVLSSVADRAIESAQILSEELIVPSQADSRLGDRDGVLRNIEDLFKVITEHQVHANAIVLVTHEPVILEFLFAYNRKHRSFVFREPQYQQGEALLIDTGEEPVTPEVI